MPHLPGLITIGAALLASAASGIAVAQTKPPGITEVDAFKPTELVAGTTPRALPVAADPSSLLDPAAWAKMREWSDAHNGVGLIVLVDGKVVGETYRAGAGPTTQTLSQSLHKSVLGIAYGIALRDHIIGSIDDPVGRYIADWKQDPRGQIPLRDFLTMTSGLHNYSMARKETQSSALVFGKDIDAVALATPLEGVPGAAFAYKNVDAQIAGIALERAVLAKTGKRYAAWLSDVLWRPLGNGPASVWLDHDGGSPHFFAWFETDLRSWARLGELVRNKGLVGTRQIVPAAWIAQATAPSPRNPCYGKFIWRGKPWSKQRVYDPTTPFTAMHSAPYTADDLVFFDGFGGQRVYVVPSRKLTIVRTGETDMAFDDAMLPNLALAGLKK